MQMKTARGSISAMSAYLSGSPSFVEHAHQLSQHLNPRDPTQSSKDDINSHGVFHKWRYPNSYSWFISGKSLNGWFCGGFPRKPPRINLSPAIHGPPGGTASSWWSSVVPEHCSWRPSCISSRSIASAVPGPLDRRGANWNPPRAEMEWGWVGFFPPNSSDMMIVLISEDVFSWCVGLRNESVDVVVSKFGAHANCKSEPQEISG